MYHQHPTVGLKPKQYVISVLRCPVCGRLVHDSKHIVVTTYTNSDKEPRISTYKSVEVCWHHTPSCPKLQRWVKSINAKLGIVLDPRYVQLTHAEYVKEVDSAQ